MYTRKELIEAKKITQEKWREVKNAKSIEGMNTVCDEYECGFCFAFVRCLSCILRDKAVFCCKEFIRWAQYMDNENFRWAKHWAEKLYLRIKNIDVDEALELANRKKEK